MDRRVLAALVLFALAVLIAASLAVISIDSATLSNTGTAY
jgi:archaellum component FlaG (FlaF/FlaG flagellin family)